MKPRKKKTEMRPRRRLTSALAALLAALLVSCGGSGTESPSVTDTESAAASETAETEPAEPGETETETGILSADTESADTDSPGTDAETEEKDKKTPEPAEETETDILGLSQLKVGEKDSAGYEVIEVNEEEGLYIAQIEGQLIEYPNITYRGYVMLVDDPSRLFLGTIPEGNRYGESVFTIMSRYDDVIAGVNASGFADANGCGSGADLVGLQMSCGVLRGTYISMYTSMFMTEDNRLVVGTVSDWEKEGARDGMQFGPVLVQDGKAAYETNSVYPYGDHPRTAIGQREDGALILMVIDGRIEGWSSLGCSMDDLRVLMLQYGAVTAGCCDGGSSCVMAYGDTLINRNSSDAPTTGRLIPNAFLIKSKKSS